MSLPEEISLSAGPKTYLTSRPAEVIVWLLSNLI